MHNQENCRVYQPKDKARDAKHEFVVHELYYWTEADEVEKLDDNVEQSHFAQMSGFEVWFFSKVLKIEYLLGVGEVLHYEYGKHSHNWLQLLFLEHSVFWVDPFILLGLGRP